MDCKGIYMAVMAGFSAACASIFAKTAASEDGAHSVVAVLSTVIKPLSTKVHRAVFTHDGIVVTTLLVRLIGVVGIFVSNTVMWIFFSKSLQLCSSSVIATVTNSTANFLLTACVSWLLFGEQLPVLWWCGSGLILTGLILVHHGSKNKAATGVDLNAAGKKTV